VDPARDHRDAVDLACGLHELLRPRPREPGLQRGELPLERALLLEELLEAGRHLEWADLQQIRRFTEGGLASGDALERRGTGDGLDPPDARGHRALRRDLEEADFAGAAEVRAAAQLGREVTDLDHADAIAVLLAEQRHRAGLERLVEIHSP